MKLQIDEDIQLYNAISFWKWLQLMLYEDDNDSKDL